MRRDTGSFEGGEHEATGEEASTGDPLVSLDQLSGADRNDLERLVDLLGERRLPCRPGPLHALQVFPPVVLRPVAPRESPGRGDGVAFPVHVAVRRQWSALRAVYRALGRVALPGPEPAFVPRGHPGGTLRFAPHEAPPATSQVQRRAADRVYQHHPDGSGIAADGARHLQADPVYLARHAPRRIHGGTLQTLLAHDRYRK